MTKKSKNAFLFFILPALFVWLCGYAAFTTYVGTLTPPPKAQQADAIIVLTGGPDRINTGLDLLEARRAGQLFISGVDPRVTLDMILALWKQEEAREPPCCVSLGYQARNTAGNARETRDWLSDQNIGSVSLVTSSYHMPRAYLEFSRSLPALSIQPYPVISENERKDKGFMLQVTFKEYNKTLLTFFKPLLKPGFAHNLKN